MIIIVLVVKDLTRSIVIIGLITNFLIISSQLTLLGDRYVTNNEKIDIIDTSVVASQPSSALLSSFNTPVSLGGAEMMTPMKNELFTTEPLGAGSPIPDTGLFHSYPGAIDFGETTDLGDTPASTDRTPYLGHVVQVADNRVADNRVADNRVADNRVADNRVADNRVADNRVADNRVADNRVADNQNNIPTGSTRATLSCTDEDAIALYDGDELNAYQVRSRNKPERIWAGIRRRKDLVDHYVREELDECENTRWWGAHEV